MSEVSVKVWFPPTASVAVAGVSVSCAGCSVALRTRMVALDVDAPNVAVSCSEGCATVAESCTSPEVWPAAMVTVPPLAMVTSGSAAVTVTAVDVLTAKESVTVRCVGKADAAEPPARMKVPVAGVNATVGVLPTAPPNLPFALVRHCWPVPQLESLVQPWRQVVLQEALRGPRRRRAP